MKIGQICLVDSSHNGAEHFASLVEELAGQDIQQHVLVASVVLARRLAECTQVTVGPVVRTPVMAYCLMPDVDLAHVHEVRSGQAGLLLTLTRSIPFVITTDSEDSTSKNPLIRSVLRRTVRAIGRADSEPDEQTAREHLAVYEEVLCGWHRSAMIM